MDIGGCWESNGIQKRSVFSRIKFSRLSVSMSYIDSERLAPSPCFQTALALLMILCLGLTIHAVTLEETEVWSNRHTGFATSFRGSGRRLAAYSDYEVNQDQLMGAEVGFVAGVVAMLALFLCLCSCCTRRFSLCEILTCFCLWEICCDDRRAGDFVRF